MEYIKILSAWHKIEHFSPATLPRGKNISELKFEPWLEPQKAKDPEKKTLEYTLFLGVFNYSDVTSFIADFFKQQEDEVEKGISKICTASLKLDEQGQYLNGSFGISTLPWALGQLEKDLLSDNQWARNFKELEVALESKFEYIFNRPENSEKSIIKISDLISIQEYIKKLTSWSKFPDRTDIYVKVIEKYKPSKNSKKEQKNTSEILNSFYVKDLEKLISTLDTTGDNTGFAKYLNGNLDYDFSRVDLRTEIHEIDKNTAPSCWPDGCWPSYYNLSLMQQYAVNKIYKDLAYPEAEGLISVNGPPGTGKTTLLRDVISSIIVQRAKELGKFDDPEEAFIKIGEIEINEKYSPFIYEPTDSIANSGIVVASSNNGAVENISKELPLKTEVGEYEQSIEYFRDVAESCISLDNWGLISAVLGNKQNRNDLVNSIWFSDPEIVDLQKFLKNNKLSDKDEWNKIKDLFDIKLNEVNIEKNRLEEFRLIVNSIETERGKLISAQEKLNSLSLKNEELRKEKISLEKVVCDLKESKNEASKDLEIIQNSKPNFFKYWFNKGLRTNYNKNSSNFLSKFATISADLDLKIQELNELIYRKEKNTESLNISRVEVDKQENGLSLLETKISKIKEELKGNYADTQFWNDINSKESQESCPWFTERLKQLQSQLFILALKVHEIFILTANSRSSRISTTLAGFFEYLKGESNVTEKEAKAMWKTFFIVIPVVSTTFASFARMFKDLSKGDIPWLFIDEAGQAVPQAAAGAIWRSRRTVVVGDPLQIEPVITVPKLIINNIRSHFGLNDNQLNSENSVQSASDRANRYGSYLNINEKQIWIGTPLRVHRRCISPMFDIANSIAYNSSMYNSTRTPEEINIKIETSFVHCRGQVEGRHYVPAQMEIIKEIIISEIDHCQGLPDLFVISPFSEIPSKLKGDLRNSIFEKVKSYIPTFEIDEMFDWLNTHIGTVHTFQGKQAEGVILCLGLDDESKGASNWASQKPNLLNVALTRAKYRFVAVGDRDIWLKLLYFRMLNKL
jgi:hypothetical protein